MNKKSNLQNQTFEAHVEGEDQFVEALGSLWIPHQKNDLEVRYQLGTMLNKKLGAPTVRLNYGIGTVRRIANELFIDKSDISRMRRFAAKYDTFETFQETEPEATCWTHVRKLIVVNNAAERPSDGRTSRATIRSLKKVIRRFESDHQFQGKQADELRLALRELFDLVKTKLDIDFE